MQGWVQTSSKPQARPGQVTTPQNLGCHICKRQLEQCLPCPPCCDHTKAPGVMMDLVCWWTPVGSISFASEAIGPLLTSWTFGGQLL